MESRNPVPVDVALYKGGAIVREGLHQHWYDRIASSCPAQLDAFVKALGDPDSEVPRLLDAMVAEAGTRSLDANRPMPIRYRLGA